MASVTMGDILRMSAIADANFKARMQENGKESKSTFFGDLTIAEMFGEKEVKDTYKRVIESWVDDIEMISEFYVALNWKIWQHYEKNDSLARLYDTLWRNCYTKILAKHKKNKEAMSYFYEFTD